MQGHASKSMLAFAKEAVNGTSKCSSLTSIRHASRVSRTSRKGTSTLDPLKPLQPMSAVPILEESERIFVPTAEDIRQGEDLFRASKTNEVGFVLSAPKPEFAPKHDMPEVAFVGRSNVGKSSLIKAIFKKAPGVVVKTSKTPGHTKMVNFFQVGRHLMLVDMPGYGFRQPRDFAESAEAYLATRKNLKNTVLLIDSNTGVKDVDLLAIEMLEQFSLPYMIVLTKIDRPSKHLLLRSVFDTKAVIRNHTSFCLPQPFLVSSLNLDGVAMLKAFIGITSGVITQSQMADSPNSSR